MSIFTSVPAWFQPRKNRRARVAERRAGAGAAQALSLGLRRPPVRAQFSLEQFEPRVLLSAVVTTDQQAYAPGATVNITGSGFQASETVDLVVVNQTTKVSYTAWTATDDTTGAFASSWTAPSNAAGDTLQLTVTGETSGDTADTTFTDGSTLTTQYSTYGPGATVNIAGAGFLAGETVDLQVVRSDGTTYAPWSVTDGTNGTFATNWTVPSDAPGYSFQITATGESSSSSATASFNAPTTWVETIPTDYSPGQTANILAGGFQGSETVDFQVTNETDGNVYPGWSVGATDGQS
jgi:hypothetical protein